MKAKLLSRLRNLLGEQDLGNGTPLADAVADAIVLEAQHLDKTAADVARISDEELRRVAAWIPAHLHDEFTADSRLPFGTEVKRFSGIQIGSKTYVPDASKPGLIDSDGQRHHAHGPNLEKLIDYLGESESKWVVDLLDTPKPATAYQGRTFHYLEFPPSVDFGGLGVRQEIRGTCPKPFSTYMSKEIAQLSKEVAMNLEHFARHNRKSGDRVSEIGKAWSKYRDRQAAAEIPELLGLLWGEDIWFKPSEREFLAKFSGLDDMLEPSLVLQPIPQSAKLGISFFGSFFEDQMRKRQRREIFQQFPGRLSISATAAYLLEIDERRKVTLGNSRTSGFEKDFYLGIGQHAIECELYWASGTLEAKIYNHFEWYLIGNELTIYADIPRGVLAASIGKPLSSIFSAAEAIDGTIIDAYFKSDGEACFRFAQDTFLFDLKTGMIGTDPLSLP